ncbi:unnamed protein product, partial [Cladocopium goreaui]
SKQSEVCDAIQQHETVKEKFFGCRKDKMHERLLNPGKRPRHAKVNLDELIKKSEEEY